MDKVAGGGETENALRAYVRSNALRGYVRSNTTDAAKVSKSSPMLASLSRCEPTTELGGMPTNNGGDLEKEADVMGKRFTD